MNILFQDHDWQWISCFRIMIDNECNILNNMSKQEFREFRSLMIEMVLHTGLYHLAPHPPPYYHQWYLQTCPCTSLSWSWWRGWYKQQQQVAGMVHELFLYKKNQPENIEISCQACLNSIIMKDSAGVQMSLMSPGKNWDILRTNLVC